MQTNRHYLTRTYGPRPNLALSPRQALNADIRDIRAIYMARGLYGPAIRSGLRQVIALNRLTWPDIFRKKLE